MKPVPLLLALLASAPAAASDATFAGFDDFAARYRASAPAKREALAASFVAWQRSRGGFPVLEQGGAVLVWFGTGRERSVAVGGDFMPRHRFSVYWDERGESMERVADGAAIWFRRVPLEPDARIDYAFRIDGRWQLDPLNPRTVGNQIGTASEIAMPGFVQPAEVIPRANVPKGTLRRLDEPWATPKVQIYLPPGYDPQRRYPVVYTADGDKWTDHGALVTILDNLVADGVIRPVIAVAIDSDEDRREWYFFNSNYLAYLARVVEWIDVHYSTVRAPEGRLHVGTSSGGRGALWAVLSRPDLFGNVGLFSANYSGPVAVIAPYATGEKRPDARLRVWMAAGSHEPYILDDTRTMHRWFERLGQPLRVVYTHGGHGWGTWRQLVKDALRYFYPASDVTALGPGVIEAGDERPRSSQGQ
jgi:enterochelin esterase family protein